MQNNVDRLIGYMKQKSCSASADKAGVNVAVAPDDLQLVKSLVDLFAEEEGFRVKTTDTGIRISQVDHIEQDVLREIVDVLVKATGSRVNLSPKTRMVQRNKPVMGYPKNGGLAAVASKYNCMVSGEKRINPCAGCGNPKGCLSGVLQFKGQDIDG
ncbi:MAG: hypothetical protein ACO3CH_00510 [Ilumatobacteraceae bacterium]